MYYISIKSRCASIISYSQYFTYRDEQNNTIMTVQNAISISKSKTADKSKHIYTQ